MNPDDRDRLDELLQIEFGCHPDSDRKSGSPSIDGVTEEEELLSRELASALRLASRLDGDFSPCLPSRARLVVRRIPRVAAALLLVALIPLGIVATALLQAPLHRNPPLTIVAETPDAFSPGDSVEVELSFVDDRGQPTPVNGSWRWRGEAEATTNPFRCDGDLELCLPTPSEARDLGLVIVAETPAGKERLDLELPARPKHPPLQFKSDRLVYNPGDSLYLWALTESKLPVGSSQALVFSVYDPKNGTLLSTPEMPLQLGQLNFQARLPKNLPSGQLWAEAYVAGEPHAIARNRIIINRAPSSPSAKTRPHLAFDHPNPPREIAEEPQENDGDAVLCFHPEGGKLVAGARNRVVVASRSESGDPVPLNGLIVDQRGNRIATVEVGTNGLGAFEIEPLARYSYAFRFESDAGKSVPLPKAVEDGVSVIARQDVVPADQPLTLDVHAPRPGRYEALVLKKNAPVARTIFFGGAPTRVELPLPTDANGLLKVALVDRSKMVRAERFVRRSGTAALQVQVEEPRPEPDGRAQTIDLVLNDDRGRPVQGVCSVNIVDAASPPRIDATLGTPLAAAAPPSKALTPREENLLLTTLPPHEEERPAARHTTRRLHHDALDRLERRLRLSQRIGGGLILLAGLVALAFTGISGLRQRGAVVLGAVLTLGAGLLVAPIATTGAADQEPEVEFAQAVEMPVGDEPEVWAGLNDSLYVNPRVKTDSEGRARLRVPLDPEGRRWRIEVDALAEGRQAQARRTFRSRAPLELRATLPPMVRGGDRLQVPVEARTADPGLLGCKLEVAVKGGRATASKKALALVEGRGKEFIDLSVGPDARRLGVAIKGQAGTFSRKLERELVVAPGSPSFITCWNGEVRGTTVVKTRLRNYRDVRLKVYPNVISEVRDAESGLARCDAFAHYDRIGTLASVERLLSIPAPPQGGLRHPGTNTLRSYLGRLQAGRSASASWVTTTPAPPDRPVSALLGFVALGKQDAPDAGSSGHRRPVRATRWPWPEPATESSWTAGLQKVGGGGGNPSVERALRVLAKVATTPESPPLRKELRSLEHLIEQPAQDPLLLAVSAQALSRGGHPDAAAKACLELRRQQGKDGSLEHRLALDPAASDADQRVAVTALAALAWMEDPDRHGEAVRSAVTWIRAQRGAHGRFGSSTATALAVAVLERSFTSLPTPARLATLELRSGARLVSRRVIDPVAKQPLVFFDLGEALKPEAPPLSLVFDGPGPLPWTLEVETPLKAQKKLGRSPFEISIDLLQKDLRVGQEVKLRVALRNVDPHLAHAASARIGLPIGLEASRERLRAARKNGEISDWLLADGALSLGWRPLAPGENRVALIPLRARRPGVTGGGATSVWPTGYPERQRQVEPLRVRVRAR